MAAGVIGLLGIFTPNLIRGDRTTAAVVLGFELLIFLVGLAACVYTWTYYLKHRDEGRPRGAVLGLLLNLLLLILIPIGVVAAWQVSQEDAESAATPAPAAPPASTPEAAPPALSTAVTRTERATDRMARTPPGYGRRVADNGPQEVELVSMPVSRTVTMSRVQPDPPS